MPKTKLLFDTNSFESSSLFYGSEIKIYFSSIVLMELMTACSDTKELKELQNLWKEASKESRLIVPSEQDIFNASRIQFHLAKDRKDAKGNATKRPSKIKQEIAMDCLIAGSAWREKVAIVTNDGDYWEIQRYLKGLKLIKI